MFLCHDMSFYIVMRDKGVVTGLFLVATKTGQGRRFYVTTGHALLRQKELLVRRFHVAQSMEAAEGLMLQ